MNPRVDKEKCIGCGTCVALAGNTFKMEDDGKAVCFDPKGDDEETIKMASDSCPTQAIPLE
ncbi:MAG: ferredoxin [Candidatus Magasanikbacteria bacterium]|jgi:ferredoxin